MIRFRVKDRLMVNFRAFRISSGMVRVKIEWLSLGLGLK